MHSLEVHKGDARLPRGERLKSKKIIEELFSKGSSYSLYPFRISWIPAPPDAEKPVYPQVLFTVPKRNFKKAVDRNRIRRQIKEVYRRNKKQVFYARENIQIPAYLGIIYVAKEKTDFESLEKKLILILQRLKT